MTDSVDISLSLDTVHQPAASEAADQVISYIEQLGVEYVFGVPGGAIEPLYNALSRSARRGGVRPIVARHESGAAFMADGYARETGKLGVCCATTGPGATNMITGVASAYEDRTPMLVITAQTSLPSFGRGASQESSCTGINTLGMFQFCTRYNSFVSHLSQLEHKLVSAILSATRSPGGPAHLSIPLDILRAPYPEGGPAYNLRDLVQDSIRIDEVANRKLFEQMSVAKQIVLIVGEGCKESIGKILELALVLDAKIVATPQGKGLISSYHPNFRGVIGLAGHKTATAALVDPSVDMLLAIGTGLDELATNGWDKRSLMNDKLVHVDEQEENFTRSPMARMHVFGNLRGIFGFLLESFYKAYGSRRQRLRDPIPINDRSSTTVVDIERRRSERRSTREMRAGTDGVYDLNAKREFAERRRIERRLTPVIPNNPLRHFLLNDEDKYIADTAPIKPQRLMYELGSCFPSNTRFLADIGNSFLWAIHYLHPLNRRVAGDRNLQSNLLGMGMGFASMGWSISASIGMALGRPGNPVVCITGDGSFLMSGGDVTAAVLEKLPVIYVILNDSSLGTVKHGQRMAGAESVGHELPQVDYAMLARSMGIDGYTIHNPGDIAALDIESICRRQGPSLLDVYIDADDPPPLGERLEMLATGK